MTEEGADGRAGGDEEPDPWTLVVEDLQATAAGYRERGWTTAEVVPELVGVVGPDAAPDGQAGLDLVLEPAAFERFRETIGGGPHVFDSFELFRAEEDGAVYAVVAIEAPDAELVVLAAATYGSEARERLAGMVDGTVHLHVRPEEAAPGQLVTFTLEEPRGLVPEAD
jgi:hypothetical protein